MTRWIFALVASVALVAAGLVHGFWTDRWATSVDTTEAATLLDSIPLQIGDWEGEEIEVKPGQAGPGVAGCVQRKYFNRARGVSVVVALVNGRPGPVSTHTPEVCYGASGYTVGDRRAVRLDTKAASGQFWTADAVRVRATEETKLRLYWAWNGSEGWVASTDAREQFPRFRFPILHKLYVLRDISGPGDGAGREGEVEPCEAFLHAFLPQLERTLFRKEG
jgi:hypothetical protein